MSYLVMARKWRPKNFEEMVGQEHIAQTLRNALSSGRIAHAFLFTGTRGVGKTTSARILAKALNCELGPTATPCEVCENCVAVNQGSSMDVLEIDGASNNGVDNVRDLREQVKYAPMQGKYKVYIIDEVHMLTKNAFNALLKTLEEPPPHVVFIFATTEVGKVPHTILSRVQRFDFRRISEAAIRDRLEFICGQEKIKPEIEALEAIARKADGSMRDALSLFDRVVAFTGNSLILEATRKVLGIPEDRLYGDLLRSLMAHDTGACFATLEGVYHQGLEISEFLTGFGEYLRDLLFSRQQGITPALLGVGEARFKELRSLALDLQDGDLLRYAKIISDLLYGLKTAVHPRLWVEMGIARMAALDRVVTLSQLMGESPPIAQVSPAPVSEPVSDGKKKNNDVNGADNARASSRTPLQNNESIQPPQFETTALIVGADGGPPKKSTEPSIPDVMVEFIPLDLLPTRWPTLIETYSIERPMTASPLRHARLQVRNGETPVVEVVFSGAAHCDLFLADGEAKRSLKTFLLNAVGKEKSFTLDFSVANATEPAPEPIAVPDSPEALVQKEPIIKTLLNLFEGRVLDGSA